VRFGKQHNGTVVIDDKLVDNRLMRSDHLREGAFEALRKKCRELKKENGRLRNLLAEHGVARASSPAMPSVEPAAVKLSLSTPEKITLFRSLFRGREDVYAQRWESQDGRPRLTRHGQTGIGRLTTLPNRRLSAATNGEYFHDVWRDLYDRRCAHQR
jgi:hypothetical protein